MSRTKCWMVLGFCLMVAGSSVHAAGGQTRIPVLVELFTSEGCSSCPPADQFLAQLVAQNTMAGVEIIAMSEHVDYWNSQGWKDPFSDVQFSRRQEEYARALNTSSPYTPEMIVDGHSDFVGSNRGAAVLALTSAGRKPKATIEITKVSGSEERPAVQVRMTPLDGPERNGPFDVYLAVTENNLSSSVARGENRGRTLSHAAVVRKLTLIGRGDGAGAFTATAVVELDQRWKADNVRLVVFAQSRKTRAILGVSAIPLGEALPVK